MEVDLRSRLVERVRSIKVLHGATVTLQNGYTTKTGTIMNYTEADEVIDAILDELRKAGELREAELE